jgi:SAM-dependent methyltransferase
MNPWKRFIKWKNRKKGTSWNFKPWNSHGYCHCCRQDVEFQAQKGWLRDWYLCANCRSIPRQRHLQLVLDVYYPGWEGKTIHESSPSADFLARYAPSYSHSQYLIGEKAGDVVEGVRCENIEALTFPNESIDIFVTQDVMEHVFHPERAFAEIMRVLKPGGIHIFSTPKHKELVASVQRAAQLDDGTVKHLKEEVYHGNPVGDGKTLVTWDYGYDFEELVSQWCGHTVMTYRTRDRTKGIEAAFNEVFVVQKSA